MSTFDSMAMHSHDIMDCRLMNFCLYYYNLPKEQIDFLGESFTSFYDELFGDSFIADWRLNGHRIERKQLVAMFRKSKSHYSFGCDADAVSKVVYDKNTFKRYSHQLLYGTESRPFYKECSVDYLDTFDALFSENQSPSELKASLLHLFNEPKRKRIGYWRGHDMLLHFCSCPHSRKPNRFYGQIQLQIALPVLNELSISVSNKLKQFLRHTSDALTNISGYISLSPVKSSGNHDHMRYFGEYSGPLVFDKEKAYLRTEWFPYTYSLGVGWFNLLSPLQMVRLHNMSNELSCHDPIFVETLPKERMIVECKENVLQTDIAELTMIKKMIYPTLYPGHGRIMLSHFVDRNLFAYGCKPRPMWEYVPIFEDEISVHLDQIEFCHRYVFDEIGYQSIPWLN